MALSTRQAIFATEYLVDGNATRAAIRAGYSSRSARAQGSRLLTVPQVAAVIREGEERRRERVELKQDDVRRELSVFGRAEQGRKYRAVDSLRRLELPGRTL